MISSVHPDRCGLVPFRDRSAGLRAGSSPCWLLPVVLVCLLAGCRELPHTPWAASRLATVDSDDPFVSQSPDESAAVGLDPDEVDQDEADDEAASPGRDAAVGAPRRNPGHGPGPPRLATPNRSWVSSEVPDAALDATADPDAASAWAAESWPPGDVDSDPDFPVGFTDSDTDWERLRLGADLKAFPGMLWADTKSLFTWQNALILGAAGGAAVFVRDDLDQQVRQETAEHPMRWGQGDVVLRQFGEYTYQVPVLLGVYATSLWLQEPKLHEFSVATISAYTLTSAITLAIKGIANTQRPTTQYENGHYGFPSFHTSSTFSIAACLDEYYGWQVGVPAYALAALVGWSRIDQREHDLSDVLFGAVLGIVVGKTVSAAHIDRLDELKISPYYDVQNQATGVSVEKRF